MTVEEEDVAKASFEGRHVLVGIRFDDQIRELLDWALVKVANPGDSVIALHICRNSDSISKAQTLLDGYLDDYEGICNQKQVRLSAGVVRGRSSVRKVLVREGKSRAAIAVLVGINKHSLLGRKVSVAKYCAKRLNLATQVMAVHNGKVVYQKFSGDRLSGFYGDPKPSLRFIGGAISTESQSEFGDSETTDAGRLSSCQEVFIERSIDYECTEKKDDTQPKDEFLIRRKSSLSSISLPIEGFTKQRPGWPLLQTTSRITAPSLEARKLSVVQWVLSLPNRSSEEVPRSRSQIFDESENAFLGGLAGYFASNINHGPSSNYKTISADLPEHLELLLKTKPTLCKAFSYEIVRKATSQFSSENLVSKGVWNRVYRGVLPDGKPVAVKISRSSRETWKEFFREVDMLTTLNHRSIASLVGICVADKDLISVYDFKPKGNLEQNLHGNQENPKLVLPWEVRFNIAVRIAEALNYLHNDCPRPIIHRDVKSSNILLNDRFEAQLSDFGLALWGPPRASFITDRDVVGTFGYLAPEYFMYGKVSDKVDVYSFGVVLLELVSGRAPIGFEKTNKGQNSLIMWAKPKLEAKDFRSIVDENLESNNINEEQVERMVLAAKLCLTQAARLRPNIRQILELLTGEKDMKELIMKPEIQEEEEEEEDDYHDDEVYPDSSAAESHLSLALVDVNDNSSSSFSSMDQSSPLFEDGYMIRRWSRSSSSD